MAQQAAQHGSFIFIYNNIRTNQVIYSLTRSLNNHAGLKQLPFLGKKTVPARLRKDLWHPFCLVEFPKPSQGLLAYRRLRELRRLHETNYPISLITQTEGPLKGRLLGTKKRGKVLMDQKANTVADLAAVLSLQEQGPTAEQIFHAEKRLDHVGRLKASGKKSMQKRDPQEPDRGGVDGVKVRWANMLDVEYAEKWPIKVMHNGLERQRYTAAFPQMDGEDESSRGREEDIELPVSLREKAGEMTT